MKWEEFKAYMGANCKWMSLEEALNAPPEWKTARDFPQGKAILAVYQNASLGAFNATELGFDVGDNNERWACIFAPLGEGTYAFVNANGEVVTVSISGP
ncbi:hypothetical protein L6250_02415 [Candidatus Parcubacteria bacterium]|nr:hypothetical protein [Patescibacteria group bacterium]MCG2688467.1 hypothetical protein [Candidatus Parcubacteria bacterium]